MDNVAPSEISGSDPMNLNLGSANVTWIIRWDSMEARNRLRKQVFDTEEWQEIWVNHPDPNGYLQIEVRFTNEY